MTDMKAPSFWGIHLTLYRCAECGKWSHAQRKPKSHERFVYEEPEDNDSIIEEVPSSYDHMNGPGDDGGWKVRCGPFETYRAYKEGTDD